MSIFLIRHGETALNATRVLQPADTPLNARGIRQAEALARRLGAVGIGGILSSDMPRALRTAEAIGAATHAPIRTTPLLQERNFGSLRGRSYDSLPEDPIASEAAPPGGESASAFETRVMLAWNEIAALWAVTDGHLAVVTHGLVIRALLSRVVVGQMELPAHIGNASVSILDQAGAGAGGDDSGSALAVAATSINCTRHLDNFERDDPQALSGG